MSRANNTSTAYFHPAGQDMEHAIAQAGEAIEMVQGEQVFFDVLCTSFAFRDNGFCEIVHDDIYSSTLVT